PAHQRYVNLYGSDAPTIQGQWESINEAIKGNGINAVTNVDARVSSHTTALAEGSWDLKAIYQTSLNDGAHENNVARQIIARAWRSVLQQIALLPVPVLYGNWIK